MDETKRTDAVPNASSPHVGREFANVDATGAAESFIRHLDLARRQSLLAEGKRWSLDELRLADGQHVLDIGCGTGDDVASMAATVGARGRAVGIDASEAMIAEARRRHSGLPILEVQVGDAQALPFDAATFDACRAERVLMHLADPAAAVREMARVLKPGGRVALIEPDWEAFLIEGADPDLSRVIWSSSLKGAGQPRVGRRLRSLLLEFGFSDVAVHAAAGVITDLELAMQRFQLDRVAADAAATGLVPREAANAWLGALREAHEKDRFLCVVLNLRAAATR